MLCGTSPHLGLFKSAADYPNHSDYHVLWLSFCNLGMGIYHCYAGSPGHSSFGAASDSDLGIRYPFITGSK
jgi:hypothetical protein